MEEFMLVKERQQAQALDCVRRQQDETKRQWYGDAENAIEKAKSKAKTEAAERKEEYRQFRLGG
eukprot:4700042-Prorocentrum_lima.AAC.1